MHNKSALIFRDFKRHYHKTRKIYNELSQSGRFSFQLKVKSNEILTKNTIPDENTTIRFMVMMRRFLTLSDKIYYLKVWNFLLTEFKNELKKINIQNLESSIENLKKGEFSINVNGEELTAEKIYDLISKAGYFTHEAKAQQLSQMPIIGVFLVDQFYGYTLHAFQVISRIFNIILKLETTEKFKKTCSEFIASEYQCIYCLSTKGNFSSEEHAFPESLGNDDVVLPVGYVCNECNNGILSQLDNFLISFGPIAFFRVFFLPITKQGKLPKANFQNALIEKIRPTYIKYEIKDSSAQLTDITTLADGNVSFNLSIRGQQKFDPILLSRALYKVALGTLAFDLGQKVACSNKYASARDFVLGKHSFDNNLLMSFTGTPDSKISISHKQLDVGTPFVINIFGLIFLLNLEQDPKFKLPEELFQQDFRSFSLNS